jgi:hypothetical protein
MYKPLLLSWWDVPPNLDSQHLLGRSSRATAQSMAEQSMAENITCMLVRNVAVDVNEASFACI